MSTHMQTIAERAASSEKAALARARKFIKVFMQGVYELAVDLMTVDFKDAQAHGEILEITSEQARAYLIAAMRHVAAFKLEA